MVVSTIEHVVVIVVIACHEVCYLTADGLRIVAAVIVQRTRLVGGLEIFHHSTADILASFALVMIFQAP